MFQAIGKRLMPGLLFLVMGSQLLFSQAAPAVAKLDFNRFNGTWYEIARLPVKRERVCIADVVEVVSLGDKANQLQFVYSCKTNRGYTDVRNATAKSKDKSGDGRLKVVTIWPLSRKSWVFALSPDYDWALMGTPNHKELQVIAKRPAMSPEMFSEVKQRADSLGFVSSKLKMTLQTGR